MGGVISITYNNSSGVEWLGVELKGILIGIRYLN